MFNVLEIKSLKREEEKMWKKILLIIALHLCGEICAHNIYRGNNGKQYCEG